ncbi:hypothetical protein [Microbacterium karelineae]|nr:hypothetical protein [Microbacterium karelineae]
MKTFVAIVGLVALGMSALAVWSAVRAIAFFAYVLAVVFAHGGAA